MTQMRQLVQICQRIYPYLPYIFMAVGHVGRYIATPSHLMETSEEVKLVASVLTDQLTLPIYSMYGIFNHIWVIFRANVGKYSIHGAYGYDCCRKKVQQVPPDRAF